MTAADGMIVRSAATSEKAEEGQDAVLEFLLLNHPLDCPVCDKGGECPLQDLAFRYGPGKSRMTLPKRTYEKPLPISPSIVLDRERCILCYRCTRFSSDVAEDGELIARERGAQSVIATFQERPYVGAFSGNVTELCPVGALLPTPYRFKARPWEIVNVPSVCQGCATGCNTWTTVREGRAERVLSRNHPEVDDGLALRPRPLRALRAARRPAPRAAPAHGERARRGGLGSRHAHHRAAPAARRRAARGGLRGDRDGGQPDQRGGLRLGPHRTRGAGADGVRPRRGRGRLGAARPLRRADRRPRSRRRDRGRRRRRRGRSRAARSSCASARRAVAART